jgi:hypothetical protein
MNNTIMRFLQYKETASTIFEMFELAVQPPLWRRTLMAFYMAHAGLTLPQHTSSLNDGNGMTISAPPPNRVQNDTVEEITMELYASHQQIISDNRRNEVMREGKTTNPRRKVEKDFRC